MDRLMPLIDELGMRKQLLNKEKAHPAKGKSNKKESKKNGEDSLEKRLYKYTIETPVFINELDFKLLEDETVFKEILTEV